MMLSSVRHLETGDLSLRFIHERPWLRVAVVGDREGATALNKILSDGILPDGKVIDRCSQNPMSDLNEVNIYIKEA